MPIPQGKDLTAQLMGVPIRVERKLGEGGQGEIFAARLPSGPCALKWYNHQQSTPVQKETLRQLVLKGPPKRSGSRFVWPQDIVTAQGETCFGYIMPLVDRGRYAALGEVWRGSKPTPSLRALCSISYQTAHAYRTLHLGGYCYRDISAGNILFDPLAGETFICDNDNVGIEGASSCQVWGTWEYMAPELILAAASPSPQTDLHSLAVLLFHLWVWHHPLHGKLEHAIRSWDLPAKRRIYGAQPIFVFDPNDGRNSLPDDSEYETARRRWNLCPPSLANLFTKAFTRGLWEPGNRVREGEWQDLFLLLRDNLLTCTGCKAENLWDENLQKVTCWNCGSSVPLPPRLCLNGPTGRQFLLLSGSARLLNRHLDRGIAEERASAVVGEVVQNPNAPEVWGLKNLSGEAWMASFPGGVQKAVPHQRACPLQGGVSLRIGACTALIVT